MNKSALRKADLITSIILMAISMWIFITSFQLLLTTIRRGRDWFESAGLFPMIVSFFLAVCAISLFNTARKAGAKFNFITKENTLGVVKSKQFKIGSIVVGMLAVYILILMLPGRQYEIVTFFYLFAAMFVFQEKNKKNLVKALVIAAIATAVLSYGFGQLAMIPLP